MGKKANKVASTGDLSDSFGEFDWVDQAPALWPLFAEWLMNNWYRFYRRAFEQLPGVVIDLRNHSPKLGKPCSMSWGDACTAMEDVIEKLSPKLPKHPSGEQLMLIHAEAKKLGLSTNRAQVEKELERFLTFRQNPKFAALLEASPWCNYFANKRRILERAGASLPYTLYPHDPDMRLAFENVISEFGSFEISGSVSPSLSRLLTVQRAFTRFRHTLTALPAESALPAIFQKAEPGLHSFLEALEAEISKQANSPDALTVPLRVHRVQRLLFYSIRRLCKPRHGTARLAKFIQELLERWPQVPAGMICDLNKYFNSTESERILRHFLGLADSETSKELRALSHVLSAIVSREGLRDSLLRLACHARARAQQHRKGWKHLQKALEALFRHICHEPSDEELIRDFERANFPWMRNLTREQRMRLLPELGNDPDHSVRDLSKKERMTLACRLLGFPSDRDHASISTQYSRAMKAIRKELRQS